MFGFERFVRPLALTLAVLALVIASPASGTVLLPAGEIPSPGANNLKNFGYSVVDGADLSGDGITDFVACGYYEGASGQNKQGQCWAFSGADLSLLFEFGSPTPQSYNVTAAFLDVNADGFTDVIMGGDLKENGRTPLVGEAYVFFLGLDRKGKLAVTGYQVIKSPVSMEGARFGHAVAHLESAPTLVAIGAPGLGKVFLYRVEGGILAGPIMEVGGGNGEFGYSMADVDGRLAVGAPGIGQVSVYSYGDGNLQSPTIIPGPMGLGRLLSALGNVDGGGGMDFAAGTGDTILVFDSVTAQQLPGLVFAGTRAAAVGTWDCDDRVDIAVSGSWFDPSLRLFYHSPVVIHSGNDGSVLATLVNASPNSYDGFGYSIAVGGDLDGDGNEDVAVGAPGLSDRRGLVYVFTGRPIQVDSDFDGVPDACDTCPNSPYTVDEDGDGVPWPCDRCPLDPTDSCLDDLSVDIEVDAGTHVLTTDYELPATASVTNQHGDTVQLVGVDCTSLTYRFYNCDDPEKVPLPPLYRMGPSLGANSVVTLVEGGISSATCDVLEYIHPEILSAVTANGVAATLCGEVCYTAYAPFDCTDEDLPCFPNLFAGGAFCDPFTVSLVNPLVLRVEVKPSSPIDPFVVPTINLGLNGNVPLVIFGSGDLDVHQVDPLSVTLSAGAVLRGTNGGDQYSFSDKDGDGYLDLVLHMDIEAYAPGSLVSVTIYGRTWDGRYLVGYDRIRILDR